VTDRSQRHNQSQIWYQYPWQTVVLCLKDLSDGLGRQQWRRARNTAGLTKELTNWLTDWPADWPTDRQTEELHQRRLSSLFPFLGLHSKYIRNNSRPSVKVLSDHGIFRACAKVPGLMSSPLILVFMWIVLVGVRIFLERVGNHQHVFKRDLNFAQFACTWMWFECEMKQRVQNTAGKYSD